MVDASEDERARAEHAKRMDAATGYRKPDSCKRYMPMSILMFILTFLFSAFLLGYLPGYMRDPASLMVQGYTRDRDPFGVVVNNMDHHRTVTLVLSGLYVMTLVNFLLCHFSSPGGVPNAAPWRKGDPNPSKTDRGFERKKNGQERYCRICLKYKPDRAHHCRVCQSCVLEMDHHCPWIRNCVGYANHKYFFLLLFYGACSLIMFSVIMMSRFVQATRNIFTWIDVVIIIAWLLDLMLAGVITAFFFFHCYLLSGAYTTIEFCEKLSTKDAEKQHIAALYQNGSPYNRGLCANICHLLGPCPLFWLLPVRWGMTLEMGLKPTPSEEGLRRLQRNHTASKANRV